MRLTRAQRLLSRWPVPPAVRAAAVADPTLRPGLVAARWRLDPDTWAALWATSPDVADAVRLVAVSNDPANLDVVVASRERRVKVWEAILERWHLGPELAASVAQLPVHADTAWSLLTKHVFDDATTARLLARAEQSERLQWVLARAATRPELGVAVLDGLSELEGTDRWTALCLADAVRDHLGVPASPYACAIVAAVGVDATTQAGLVAKLDGSGYSTELNDTLIALAVRPDTDAAVAADARARIDADDKLRERFATVAVGTWRLLAGPTDPTTAPDPDDLEVILTCGYPVGRDGFGLLVARNQLADNPALDADQAYRLWRYLAATTSTPAPMRAARIATLRARFPETIPAPERPHGRPPRNGRRSDRPARSVTALRKPVEYRTPKPGGHVVLSAIDDTVTGMASAGAAAAHLAEVFGDDSEAWLCALRMADESRGQAADLAEMVTSITA